MQAINDMVILTPLAGNGRLFRKKIRTTNRYKTY